MEGHEKLKGKVAMVTGAARGIGREVAIAFAREGAAVIGLDAAGRVSATQHYPVPNQDDLETTGRAVQAAGVRWYAAVVDIRSRSALAATAAKAVAALGSIDILAAIAGIQSFKALLDMEDADWHDQIDINLTGTANTLRAIAPQMVRQGHGRIIITSSTQGRHGMRNGSAYSASKWGLFGLAKSAALELGPAGVTVNVVVPGLIDTALTRNVPRYEQAVLEAQGEIPRNVSAGELEKQVAEGQKRKLPLGIPWIEPGDVAPIYVYLASDEARMITGATFDVTAGDSAHNVC